MTTLGELTRPKVDQLGPPEAGEFVYVDISSVDNKSKRVVEPKRIGVDAAPSRARQRLKTGDVLVSMTRPNLNAVAIVPPNLDGAVGSTGFHVLRANERVLPGWLYYGVQSRDFIEAMSGVVQGALYPAVRPRDIQSFDLRAPGVDEQCRIVAEIEKQFSRLDEAVSNLQRVKANLKRYKAAVLTAAVSGNLVEIEAMRSTGAGESEATGLGSGQWRKPSKKSGREARKLGTLPEGWTWAEAADLASPEPSSICAGPFGTVFKAKDFRPAGVPIIFLRHVAPLRYLDRKPGFMDVGKWEELFKPYSAFGGELLITKLGEPPGVCAMYPRGIGPAMVTPDVIKMDVDSTVASPAYVMYYFNREIAKQFATGAAFGTTRTRLTLPLFREMPVALPPLAEQHRIVAEVDRRLSIVREVEAEVDANLKRAASLRQAVLSAAFAIPGPRETMAAV